MSYPYPEAIVYTEIVLDELGLSLEELNRRTLEAQSEWPEEHRTHLDAVVHNRVDVRIAQNAAGTLEEVAMSRRTKEALAAARAQGGDHYFGARVVDEEHEAREARIEQILAPEERHHYARYFLTEGPILELTSQRGRSWDEAEKAMNGPAYRELRLQTSRYGGATVEDRLEWK